MNDATTEIIKATDDLVLFGTCVVLISDTGAVEHVPTIGATTPRTVALAREALGCKRHNAEVSGRPHYETKKE